MRRRGVRSGWGLKDIFYDPTGLTGWEGPGPSGCDGGWEGGKTEGLLKEVKGEPVHGEHDGSIVRMARKLQGSANRIEGGMVDDFGDLGVGQTLGHCHLHAMNTALWTYHIETTN